MTWSEWSALVPDGQMVDHPEVLRLAEALRRHPAYWGWCDSDGPPSLRSTAHVAFACLLRLSSKYRNFSYGMGCKIPVGGELDDRLGIPGLYVALKESGMIESEYLANGTAVVRAKEAQNPLVSERSRPPTEPLAAMNRFLDRMES